jgi:hypothetical protein
MPAPEREKRLKRVLVQPLVTLPGYAYGYKHGLSHSSQNPFDIAALQHFPPPIGNFRPSRKFILSIASSAGDRSEAQDGGPDRRTTFEANCTDR